MPTDVITPFRNLLEGCFVYLLLKREIDIASELEKVVLNEKIQIPQLLTARLVSKLQTFKQFYIFWDAKTTTAALAKQFPNEWKSNRQIDGGVLKSLITKGSAVVIEYLTSDPEEISKEFCDRIIKWIHSMDIIKVSAFDPVLPIIEAFGTGAIHTLTAPLIHLPFKTNDQITSKISNCFEKLLMAREKGSIKIPFLACSPGTGKSRTLQEIFPHTKQGKELKNSIQIHVSFGGGTPFISGGNLSPDEELVSRIIFSYYQIDVPFLHFQTIFASKKVTLVEVLQSIYNHFFENQQEPTNVEHLYIYLAIDEFTELNMKYMEVDSNVQVERSYLEVIIRTLGSFIININSYLSSKIHILPIFAGLDYNLFTHSISKSTYHCEYISPYIFNIGDVSNLIDIHLPSLRYSPTLWKVINLLGSNSRFLEYLIYDLKASKTILTPTEIKAAYEEIINTNFRERTKLDLSIHSARKLIATVILGEEVELLSVFDIIEDKKFTWKQLEDSALVRLSNKSEKSCNVTTSLECLKYCSSKLENGFFKDFLNRLFDSIFQSMTSSTPFETFNGIFDIVRNYCLLFLGKKNISLKERFPGIETQVDIESINIDLEDYPKELARQEMSLLSDCSKMIHNSTENSCFFDRFSKCSTKSNNISYILWQDRGYESDLQNFTQSELDEIVKNQFTDAKLEKLGADKNNSLAIVITNRLSSKTLILPKGFAILDRKGLEKYYGPFISSIFLHSILLPFPIFQTQRYSPLNLALLLGVEERTAAFIRTKIAYKQINSNNIISQLPKLDPELLDTCETETDETICDIPTPTDGNCLFNACILGKSLLSDSVQHCTVPELRRQVAEYMSANIETEAIVAQMVEIIGSQEFDRLDELGLILKKISHKEYLTDRLEELVPDYIENMKKNGVWGGSIELGVIAKLLNLNIIVKGDVCIDIVESPTNTNQTITLFLKNKHYQLRMRNKKEII